MHFSTLSLLFLTTGFALAAPLPGSAPAPVAAAAPPAPASNEHPSENIHPSTMSSAPAQHGQEGSNVHDEHEQQQQEAEHGGYGHEHDKFFVDVHYPPVPVPGPVHVAPPLDLNHDDRARMVTTEGTSEKKSDGMEHEQKRQVSSHFYHACSCI
jgi:hypothetical protein